MEFNSSKQRLTRNRKPKSDVRATEYTDSLHLYTVPPTETISLQEFEDLAIDRLKGACVVLLTSALTQSAFCERRCTTV